MHSTSITLTQKLLLYLEFYIRTGIGLEQGTCTFLEFDIVINMGSIDHFWVPID